MGFEVWGVGFGVCGLRCGVRGFDFGGWMKGSGSKGRGLGVRVVCR